MKTGLRVEIDYIITIVAEHAIWLVNSRASPNSPAQQQISCMENFGYSWVTYKSIIKVTNDYNTITTLVKNTLRFGI